jgi:predicted ArsR family transcriptional regulator
LEETKALVDAYLKKQFKKKKQVYPSDVADALGLRYETVRQVFDDLERDGKIREELKDLFSEVNEQDKRKKVSEAAILREIQTYRLEKRAKKAA